MNQTVMKTMIVEDDLMVASLNGQFANRTPEIQVVGTFHNGMTALDYLNQNEVDLILLDLYLPDISGLELLQRLRSRNSQVGVIMITAANDGSSLEQALRLGIVDYLVKPFHYERFSMAINKFLVQRGLTGQKGSLTQDEIDRAFSMGVTKGNSLQKGIQRQTLTLVMDCLRENVGSFLTNETIAEQTGLSKVTTRRYLNYLLEIQTVVSRINYSTGGRPSIEYRLVGSV